MSETKKVKLVARIFIQNGKMSLEITGDDKLVHSWEGDAPAEVYLNDVLLDLASFSGKKTFREKFAEFREKLPDLGKKILDFFNDLEKTASKDKLP